jgi:hypothetical protein
MLLTVYHLVDERGISEIKSGCSQLALDQSDPTKCCARILDKKTKKERDKYSESTLVICMPAKNIS